MIEACFSADVTILLIANGEKSPQRGLHCEMGAALAGSGDLIVWVPPEHGYMLNPEHPRCISFYCHKRVTRIVCHRDRLMEEIQKAVPLNR